jgi:hypothetical protein
MPAVQEGLVGFPLKRFAADQQNVLLLGYILQGSNVLQKAVVRHLGRTLAVPPSPK